MTSRRTATKFNERGILEERLRTQGQEAQFQAAARLREEPRANAQLRLRLSASPEEVPVARAAITRLCEHLEINDEQTNNIRLAVTEACSNCAMHAYEESTATGTYVLAARVDRHALLVTICDSGQRVHNTRASIHPGLGCGLSLIQALADSAEITSRPNGGTRVVMRFAMCA